MSWLSQRWSSRALIGSVLLWTAWLSACGGGQQPPHGLPDTTGPTFNSASATKPSPDVALVSADASDNGLVTGYCAKVSSVTPSATDGCFTNTQPISVDISTLTTSAKVYVWARDAAGNVSTARAVDINRCSEQGQSFANANAYAKVVCLGVGAINGNHSGEILIGLEPAAPISVNNFLAYVNADFYSGTVFHRVMSNFMVQAGGSTFTQPSTYSQKTTGLLNAVALERTSTTGLSNTQYTVALARTSAPDSATSQFFINVVDNSHTLDASGTTDPGNGYAVFGKVISGTSTVDLIKAVPVGSNGSGETSQPTGTPPTILWAYRIK